MGGIFGGLQGRRCAPNSKSCVESAVQGFAYDCDFYINMYRQPNLYFVLGHRELALFKLDSVAHVPPMLCCSL